LLHPSADKYSALASPSALAVPATIAPALPIGRPRTGIAARALPAPPLDRYGTGLPGRLRIAIVSPEVGAGAGVPHYWLALAAALSHDHEVHVFTASTDRVRLAGVKYHRIPALPFGWFLGHVSFYLAAKLRFLLARAIRPRPFDVVLGVGALTPFADVTTVHFVQAREIELQRRGLIPRPRPLVGLAGLDYALYGRSMAWLGRRFYRRSSASIVAISQSVKQDVAQFEGADLASISVVPNGVDIERFSLENRARFRDQTRKSLGLSNENTAVLFVGNSWGRKGLQTAIQAIAGPDQKDVRLVVVGDGDPSGFLNAVPSELAARIIFVGPKSLDVERYYAAADVFILPTLYEPFGLVILEALASGLPTIVSACAGASEWLRDGVDAIFLRDPADGEEAQTALRSIICDPEFAARLSRNGRLAAEGMQWLSVGNQLIAASVAHKRVLAARA
jgi:UDP-glucose:(heptosyl)LPS alpha-1,3-glucosyltransferase